MSEPTDNVVKSFTNDPDLKFAIIGKNTKVKKIPKADDDDTEEEVVKLVTEKNIEDMIENSSQKFVDEMEKMNDNFTKKLEDMEKKQEDTLENPQHEGEKFEAIVANPPFSAKWSANPLHLNNERFSEYGKLAPKSKADFAFVQHMIHHLDDNGTMVTVLPHGVLFRGGAEEHIRKYLIEDKLKIKKIYHICHFTPPPLVPWGISVNIFWLLAKTSYNHLLYIHFQGSNFKMEKLKINPLCYFKPPKHKGGGYLFWSIYQKSFIIFQFQFSTS